MQIRRDGTEGVAKNGRMWGMASAKKAWDGEGKIMTLNLDLTVDGSVPTRDGKLSDEDLGRKGLYTIDLVCSTLDSEMRGGKSV